MCSKTIEMIHRMACASCELEVMDMRKPDIADQARRLGIRTVPSVVVDGELADCFQGSGPDEKVLRSLGVGIPL
jgi:thioredoxin-like negative regulator of GroEL